MSLCKECQDANDQGYCTGGCYPYYGVCPHTSFAEKDGKVLIYTQFKEELLPDNFMPDPDVKDFGTYYCPNDGCDNSKEEQFRRYEE